MIRRSSPRWRLAACLVLGAGCHPPDLVIPPPPPPPVAPFVALATMVHGLTDASLLAAFTDQAGTPWVGSSQGAVLTRTGPAWRSEPLPGGGVAIGIWGGESGELLVAAGTDLFQRESDGTWHGLGVPSGGNVLLGIWGLSPADAWVHGVGGLILRRTGTGWVPATTGTTAEIWGIGGSGLDDLVAVGQSGTILESRDSGVTWLARASPTVRTLFAVASEPGGRIVAVGSGGTIVLREGDTWRTVDSPTFLNLFDIKPAAPGRFTVLGDGGTILEGDGVTWQQAEVRGARENLRGITGPVGHRTAVGWAGTILDESTGWGTALAGGTLYGVHVPATGPALAVGTGGLAYARHVGGGWVPVHIPTPASLYGVAGPSGTDRIAVGDSGTIMHQQGDAWTREAVTTGALLRSVWYDGTHAMAVGRGGTVLVREHGSWRSVASGTGRFLRRVAGDRWDRLYIVGDSGTAMVWDGARLANLSVGTEQNLRGIAVSGERDVWFVGDFGTIIRGEGSGWVPQYSPTLNDIRGIRRYGSSYYIIGDFRQVYRFDGTTWTSIGVQAPGFWLDIAGESELVVVGELGRIDEGRR